MAKKQVTQRDWTLQNISRKLDKVLRQQEQIIERGKRLERKEEKELTELEKLEALEKKIAKEVEPHPLRRLTYRDVIKGSIGAFIGVMAHYTFVYGIKVAHEITLTRAIILFPLSFIVGGLFMYVAGFRKVKDPKLLMILPVRLIVLYMIAITMAILVLFFFQPDFGMDMEESIKQIATVTLLGLVGACTADLIGKE